MISKNLAQRIAVAAVAIPAILWMVFRGGDLFLYFVILLAAVGMYEYLKNGGHKINSLFFLLPFCGTIAAVYLTATGRGEYGGLCLLAVFLLVGMISALGRGATDRLFSQTTYIVWGTLLCGMLWPYIYLLRGKAELMMPAPGRWWIFFLLGALWLGDTAAMAFGHAWGRHKLAPVVSPNKTVEGFIGGFVGVFLVAALFKFAWMPDVGIGHFLALSILIGTFGQLGDLTESLWKRSLGIKDSSSIIPGHGGVLDRFDSLLFAAPVVFLYLKYVLHAPWL